MSSVPVRVAVRVRPILPSEALEDKESCVSVVDGDQLIIGKDKQFRFDHIFPPSSSQSEVYQYCVFPSISACLDGYNSTVFAYGQTNAGKSYTMGSEGVGGWGGEEMCREEEEERGIIPRALADIFQEMKVREASVVGEATQWRVGVSYIEIYREELRDLLDCGMGTQSLAIRDNEQGHTVVVGAIEQTVTSSEEALSLLYAGNTARITEATELNRRSSRSHAVFTVIVERRWWSHGEGDTPQLYLRKNPNTSQEHYTCGKFHFVDLAGSERAGKTSDRGDRFKESVHINSGLLALGNVISALGDPKRNSSHVPYRDSKITRLLKDSLGGNSRTFMIACLNPLADNIAETLNTLKFAKRARNIRNHPIINRDPHSTRLHEMEGEIRALREELLQVQSSKPATRKSVSTVDTSIMARSFCTDSRTETLEHDLHQSRQLCIRLQTVLNAAKSLAEEMKSEAEGLAPEVVGKIDAWVKTVMEAPLPPVASRATSSAEPFPAMISPQATIELLRRELERCHVDLETDEELYAEKVEELNELQSNCEQMRGEIERLKGLWEGGRRREGELQEEVWRLSERVAELEGERKDEGEEEGVEGDGSGGRRKEGGRESGEWEGGGEEKKRRGGGGSRGDETEGGREKQWSEEDREERGRLCEKTEGNVALPSPGQGDMVLSEFNSKVHLLKGRVRAEREEDLCDEAVLKSLRTLTSVLAHSESMHGQIPPRRAIDGGGENSLCNSSEFGRTHTIGTPPVQHGSRRQVQKEEEEEEEVEVEEEEGKHLERKDEQLLLSLETSVCEPTLSLSGRWSRDRRANREMEGGEGEEGGVEEEVHILNQSTLVSKQQLSRAQDNLLEARNELRDLNIKIRLKEEWIQELVRSNLVAKKVNQMYVGQIQGLEQEAAGLQRELRKTQKVLQKQQEKDQESSESQKLIQEQKKRLTETEKRLAAVQKKQRDTQRIVNMGLKADRRVEELESGIERLRSRQESMKRKLKKHTEQKTKLESDVQMYQQRLQQLQSNSERQQKVLKVKTHEAAVAQRKLRQLSSHSSGQARVSAPTEREWLETEMEKVLQQKQAMESLEKELAERERLVREREAAARERAGLEMKELHYSQSVARDLTRMSVQIQMLQSSIHTSQREAVGQVDNEKKRKEVSKLQKERDRLIAQTTELQERAHNTSFLSSEEERRLLELSEHIEVLETAIQFKNETISSRELKASQILESDELRTETATKLQHIPHTQAKVLLASYFDKVVELRLLARKKEKEHLKMAAETEEERKVIQGLQRSVKLAQVEMERRLLSQEKEHQQQLQLLMEQLATQGANTSNSTQLMNKIQSLSAKVKTLERELYYYKKTSRDLKRKLRTLKDKTDERMAVSKVDSSGRDHKSEVVREETVPQLSAPLHAKTSTNTLEMGESTEVTNVSRETATEVTSSEPERCFEEGQTTEGGVDRLADSLEAVQIREMIGRSEERVGWELAGEGSKGEMKQKGRSKGAVTRSATLDKRSEKLGKERMSAFSSSCAESHVTAAEGGTVWKPRKQLRQLSSSEIAERCSESISAPPREL